MITDEQIIAAQAEAETWEIDVGVMALRRILEAAETAAWSAARSEAVAWAAAAAARAAQESYVLMADKLVELVEAAPMGAK